MNRSFALAMTWLIPCMVHAQTVTYPPPAFQIAAAVSPLPENLRAGARVLGYDAGGKLVALRRGTNDMVCIADDPSSKTFHVACYHRSLEAFMERGRQLHALKKSKEYIDSTRLKDVQSGRYSMPAKPAALYQYFAPRDSVDMSARTISGAQFLYVVYTPYATYQSTGISEVPVDGGPWVMFPGKPWAHLMIQPQNTTKITIKP
ncbi:MAG TPA: hypothetical protein VF042_16560 [Gemmatimonadaceae bacterium]